MISIAISKTSFGVTIDDYNVPGVIESMSKLISIHKKKFKVLASKNSTKNYKDFKEADSFQLHPSFMSSIILHSDNTFIDLLVNNNNPCYLYSLIENNLLKTAEGSIKNILVTFKNKQKRTVLKLIPLKHFIDKVYKIACFTNKQTSHYYKMNQISLTIKKLNLKSPSTYKICEDTIKFWKKNRHLPYACKIPTTIKNYVNALGKGKKKTIKQLKATYLFYRKNISEYNRNYLNNLCSNIYNSETFCSKYLDNDIWGKILKEKKRQSLIVHRCKIILKQEKLSSKNLSRCIEKIKGNPNLCISLGANKYPSLFPQPNCPNLKKTLGNTRILANSYDCPGNVNNESIINSSRIIMNFKKDQTPLDKGSCIFNQIIPIANEIIKSKITAWPIKACYTEIISKEKKCLDLIPSAHSDHKLSENNVIAKILYQIKGFSHNDKCTIIDKKKFKPALLEFKHGCYIVKDKKQCSSFTCKREIFLNNKKVSDIEFLTNVNIDYFPNTFLTGEKSITSIFMENLHLKRHTIFNLTILLNFFEQYKNGIIHGVGCISDLIPHFFRTKVINSCKPTPFIIDGVVTENNKKTLIVRLPIDNIHAPRLIKWSRVFSSVSSFKNLHPLNSWILYGIRN